ncbi:hypothetical protein F5887DRAFT_1284361 [Amanita rubescens]|nr:hypothetical protein F5887DRAFT_1284361 [Amanita rubescens]
MTDSFDNLPQTTQRRIDKAFDAIASSASPEPRNGVPVYQEDTAGGFLLDAEPGPGLSNPSHIPFSLVPDALCRLNLPTDDDQILSVFRNAASGWRSATNTIDESHVSTDGLVSRDDWRSVCAVLLEHADDQAEGRSSDGSVYENFDLDGSEGSDYVSNGGESDDDYQEEGPTTRSRGPRTRRTGSGLGAREEYTLTKQQQEACLEAYSLFFPSIPLTDLPNKNIMIKDIQRVAKLLGEKLTAEDVIAMLEAFSSSPDKSVSLADFSRMMVAAKLV